MTAYYVRMFVRLVALVSLILLPWVLLACVVWAWTH